MRDAELLGADLRAARDARDVTLAQAEQQTRIRSYYLEALETGSFEVLPSAVQGRGFLRNYARYLGLDPEIMVARFDSALNGGNKRSRQQIQPQSAPPLVVDPARPLPPPRRGQQGPFPDSFSPRPPPSPDPAMIPPSPRRARTPPTPNTAAARGAEARRQRNRNNSLVTIAILITALVVLLGLVIFAIQSPTLNGSVILSPASTLPTIEGIEAIVTPSDSPTQAVDAPAPGTATPARPSPLPNPNTPQPSLPAGQVAALNMQITVKRRVSLRIIVDSVQVATGNFTPDNVLQYQGKKTIQLICSNADAIEVTLNGSVVGDLGQPQQAIDRIFNAP